MKFFPWMLFGGVMLFSHGAMADEQIPQDVKRIPKVMLTADELANPDLYHPRMSFQYVPPPVALPAPPPAGSLRPGEFEAMDSNIITVLNYGAPFMNMWVEMLQVYSQAGHTWIIAHEPTKGDFKQMLDEAGVPESSYSWLNYPVNTIWIRDYGPEFVVTPDGERIVFDADYSHRPLDDVVPQLMAASDWIGSDSAPLEINLTEHMLSGGNMMSDGAGTCFFSDIIYGYEMPSGWTAADVDTLMADYLGCEQSIVLNPICNDGTGHIDLYAKAMAATSILLGEFPPNTYFDGSQDAGGPGHCGDDTPDDYQDQEDNLAILQATENLDGEPWVITRIPLLDPYAEGGYWVYRSYLNSEIFNNYVAMPSYYAEDGPETAAELLDIELLAIEAYETALVGVNVIAIDSDHIIPMAGAMHCITHEIPQEAGGAWEPPAEYCSDGSVNGDEECDGDDFGGLSCADYSGGYGDYLTCNADCTIDASGCPPAECGDGIVSGDEECDPCAPQQPACADYGLGIGDVGCNLDCTLNTINCVEATACEAVAGMEPGVVCCPDPPPEDCAPSSWDWSDQDSYYGCCNVDMSHMLWCDGQEFFDWSCDGICGYVSAGPYVDCMDGALPNPAPEDHGIDCPDIPVDGQDAGPDAGSGKGGDDGCGCVTAGRSELPGVLAALLSLLFG